VSHRAAVCAHQGGGERFPRGSWAAFEAAVCSDVDYVEFDVRRTRGGELVVFHDKLAERRGLIPHALSRRELADRMQREIPTLRDVLGLFNGRVKAHIDIKEPGYEAEVLALAAEMVGLDRFVVTGEDAVVRASKRACPGAYAGLSLGRGPHEIPLARLVQVRSSEWWPIRRVRACGADAVAMHHRLARAGALRTVARNGIDAMFWTVNDPKLIRRFVRDPRVGVLITDYPELALAERS